MPGQERVHDRALDADAASVDQPDLAEPALPRSRQILLDDRHDVARRERVQIQRVLDRDPNRFIFRFPSPLRGGVRDGGISQIFGPVITCFCQWS